MCIGILHIANPLVGALMFIHLHLAKRIRNFIQHEVKACRFFSDLKIIDRFGHIPDQLIILELVTQLEICIASNHPTLVRIDLQQL